MKTHKDLDVWNEGIGLVLEVYKIVKQFPIEEKFGLSDQIRRSAISIPSNIAEGAARNSKKEFLQFLFIALGSLSELETQLIIAKKLEYLEEEMIFTLLEREKSKILGLIRYLKESK